MRWRDEGGGGGGGGHGYGWGEGGGTKRNCPIVDML